MTATPQVYQTQQVMTASPAKLVAMLYDRAILSLKEAIRAIEDGDIQARYNANYRAGEILTHLWTTLDRENGGEIAENLGRLYSFMLGRLANVDIRNDPAPAREVIALLEPLRDSWGELAHGGPRSPVDTDGAASAPSPARPSSKLSLSA